MSNISLTAVSKSMVPLIWDSISDMIEIALAHSNGELDMKCMKAKIEDGTMLLVLVHRSCDVIAALTFEKRKFDTGKYVLMVTTAGGVDVDDWVEQMSDMGEMLAREKGCEDIYIIGRAGWQRKLKDIGFSIQHTVLSRKVGG